MQRLKLDGKVRSLVIWFGAATALICLRSVFRIVEPADGYLAPVFRDEKTYIVSDSV